MRVRVCMCMHTYVHVFVWFEWVRTLGLRAVTSIRDSCSSLLMRVVLASMPCTQLPAKEVEASPSRRMDCSRLLIIMGLNTLSSKWPWDPAMLMPTWLPMTCQGARDVTGVVKRQRRQSTGGGCFV